MSAQYLVPAGLRAASDSGVESGIRMPMPQRVRAAGLRLVRHGEPVTVRGVTYGPFEANEAGEPLPEPDAVMADFAKMREAAINAVRIYHPPPSWFLDLAERAELMVLLDVPCPKHLDFLESRRTRDDAVAAVRKAVRAAAGRSCLLGTSIGNEIPPDIVRWYGADRVSQFLGELADAARQADPLGLVTYGNYPPTEYLELPFLDYLTFNVYLHDRSAFRRYLHRLLNLAGDRPLVLGEIGMDTLRHGEAAQAALLGGHLREAALLGTTGAFVFAWTDDWFTHGYQIDDWAFGLTRKDRSPKPAYHAVAEVFTRPTAALLKSAPRVSVVVCSYNGGRTLAQCLESLERVEYPNFEVILVDDGSTDDTPAIVAQFPQVRTIRQPNRGLSAARNVGMEEATGEIVAYTDSDCFADPDWLARLVEQLETSGAAAVGGPNLSPDDGPLAACVDAAPGQPTHVLESDAEAEHIPGCNMAYRREVLRGLGGFDPQFRKAGDDVDLCWRLLDAGHRITFAPAAFVWHHRRQTPRAYLKQQAGYGEAEALLARKHPARFNALGGAVWLGVVYGACLSGVRLAKAKVFTGKFGQGLFQTIYQPGPSHVLMLASTLEWHVAALIVLILGFAWQPLWLLAAGLVAATVAVTALQAIQARIPRRYDGAGSRWLVAWLCWAQPLARGKARYAAWWKLPKAPAATADFAGNPPVLRYLTGTALDRATLLQTAAERLTRRGWETVIEDGWSGADLLVKCRAGRRLEIVSTQEWYQGPWAQVAIRFRLGRSAERTLGDALAVAAAGSGILLAAFAPGSAALVGCAVAAAAVLAWRAFARHGRWSAACAVRVFDETARSLGLSPHVAAIASEAAHA